MKINQNFDIGTIILIDLIGPHYFNPYDGRREIDLTSKAAFDKEFNVPNEVSPERGKRVQELGWIKIHHVIGKYVGGRPNVIKIMPFYGIMHFESEYFIIYENQIKNLVALQPVKKKK